MKLYVCIKVTEISDDEPQVESAIGRCKSDAVDKLLDLNGLDRKSAETDIQLPRPMAEFDIDPFGLAEAMSDAEGPWFYCEQHPLVPLVAAAEVVDLVVDLKTPIEVYTDGACSPNPGPGGWAAIIRQPGQEDIELSGYGGESTTNNQMELMGAIQALERIPHAKGPLPVTLYTDSQYVKNGIMSWIQGWKRNGWMTAARKPVLNKELWQRLDAAQARHTVSWRWVRGHNGHPLNERADQLAVAASRQRSPA